MASIFSRSQCVNRLTTLLNYSKLPRGGGGCGGGDGGGGGGGDGGVCAGGGGVGIEHGCINLTEYHRDWLDIDHRISQKSHNAPFWSKNAHPWDWYIVEFVSQKHMSI